MNKVFRKLVSAATTAALLVTMIPAGIVASATSSALPLYLNKTAVQKSGSTNEWNVTLTVSGSSSTTKTTSDIVIVFDASGSMANYMTKAKNGAKTIVNTVLSGNKSQTTRVAAVAFSGGIDNSCNLSNSASYVNGVIDSFYAGGGTNTQLGIYTAEQLLKSSTATNKFIVLLSDGEPTYSYKASSATKYTSTNNPLVSYSGITRSDFTLSGFDYNNLLGFRQQL
jgi:Mg-chelatase subunit ChlD